MDKEKAYGCVFCITGKETAVAEAIRNSCRGVYAVAAQQEKHYSVDGKKYRMVQVMLPGYVFFCTADADAIKDISWKYSVRLLEYSEGDWRLDGKDKEFAEWLLAYNGVIGFSKACQEGNRIHILSGPLKDMEGLITRIDRRGRSGQITAKFSGREIKLWLGFELTEPADKEQENMTDGKG